MFLELCFKNNGVLDSFPSNNKSDLFKFFDEKFSVDIWCNTFDGLFGVVHWDKFSSFDKNSDDALNMLFGHCEMQRRSAILILGQSVCTVFGGEDVDELWVAWSCCPVQGCHLQVVDIECQVRVLLKQLDCIFVPCLNKWKKFMTIIVIVGFFYHAFVGNYLFQTQVLLPHGFCQFFYNTPESNTQIRRLMILNPLLLQELFWSLWIWLNKITLLENPVCCFSFWLFRHSKRNFRNCFICIRNLLKFGWGTWWSWKVYFEKSWQLAEGKGLRFRGNLWLIFEEIFKFGIFLVIISFLD